MQPIVVFDASGNTDVTCSNSINDAPDYFFDPARQPAGVFLPPAVPTLLSDSMLWYSAIRTSQPRNSVDVWISSRDYGGYGHLTASANVGGQTILATIGQSSFDHAARLPVDVNGDFIADRWAQSLGLTTLDPGADAEINLHGAPPGDGFSGFEEYRGFIVVSQPTACAPNCTAQTLALSHARTNPVTAQDVFVADPDSLFDNYGNILKDPMVTPFVYHSLSVVLANPIDTVSALGGFNVLRRGYTNHVSNVFAFPLINGALAPDVFGNSGGNQNDGNAVTINATAIQLAAAAAGFSPSVLMAQTIAHEVGHKFRLEHYRETRLAAPGLLSGTNASVLQSSPQLLPSLNYAPCYLPPCGTAGQGNFFDPVNQKLYIWIQMSYPSGGGAKPQNRIAVPQTGDLQGRPEVTMRLPPASQPPYDGVLLPPTSLPANNIAQFTIPGGASLPTPPVGIDLWIQRMKLMDWTARLEQAMNGLNKWQFDTQLDLPVMSLCREQSCPQ